MTPRTLANIQATCELVRLVALRVIRHADDFQNDDALNALTAAQRSLEHAGRLLQQVPTMESPGLVMRESLRVVERKNCEEVAKS